MFQQWLLMCMVASVVYADYMPTSPPSSQCTLDDDVRAPTVLVYTSGKSPILRKLASEGVRASVNPFFPNHFTPKHYSIVTGMDAESHGIIDDVFNDSELGTTFDVCDPVESSISEYYNFEPIWSTAMQQAVPTAVFWPGADVDFGGQLPTYTGSNLTSTYQIIFEVLKLMNLPTNERPGLVLISLNDPCVTKTIIPGSDEETEWQEYLDHMLEHLVEGLEENQLLSCVNLIILSEQEVQPSQVVSDPVINLREYIPDIEQVARVVTGDFPRIDPKVKTIEEEQMLISELVCKHHALRAYQKKALPKRFHFSNNPRIENIVLDIDPGYTVTLSDDIENQGYGYYKKNKQTKFVAIGPEFRKNKGVEPFDLVELYNLLAQLTGVRPLANDGTLGSLYPMMVQPLSYPVVPVVVPPTRAQYPRDEQETLLSMSNCPHDLQSSEVLLESLDLTSAEKQTVESVHMPWGISYSSLLPDVSIIVLHNPDQVTGYSEALKIPLWSSYTVENGRVGTPENEEWFTDVRLTPETTQTCASYAMLPSSFKLEPLFPPQFSSNPELPRLPYLVSNAVPISDSLRVRWRTLLLELIPTIFKDEEPFNLVVGPVIDLIQDDINASVTPVVPSDLFAVITICKLRVTHLKECPEEELNVVSFIYPNEQVEDNCMTPEQYASQYRVTVSDVEKVTGLVLFPEIRGYYGTKLLTSHQELFVQS